MTNLLEEAIASLLREAQNARLKTLPPNEQDPIAAIILEELEDEKRWDTAFAKSQNVLAKLASEAMAEYRAGKTQELDPERL